MKLWQHGGTFRVKEDNDKSLLNNGSEKYVCLGQCDEKGNLLTPKTTEPEEEVIETEVKTETKPKTKRPSRRKRVVEEDDFNDDEEIIEGLD